GGIPERVGHAEPQRGDRLHATLAAMRAGLQSWAVTLGILVLMGLVFVGVGVFELILRAAPGDVVGAGLLHSAVMRRDVVPFLVTTLVAFIVYVTLPPWRIARLHAWTGALIVGALNFAATRLFTLSVALATRRDVISGS